MKDHTIRKPILLGLEGESGQFQIDFFGRIYGRKGEMTPMPRSHAIAFSNKLCDPSKKKLQVPEHPRIADDLLRKSSCGLRTETRLQYAGKSKERETRTTVCLDPTGWIPLSGDSETGWYGLFIPNKYACLLHGPSFAARVFAG